MQHFWIKHTNSKNILIFFAGWAMDEKCVSQIAQPQNDAIVFFDYNNLSCNVDLSSYQQTTIVAWSMGVLCAEHFMTQNNIKPTRLIAIAGTGCPVDQSLGIDPNTCMSTYTNLTERTLKKFQMRMCGGSKQFALVEHLMPSRNIENQKSELFSIMQLAKQNIKHYQWDKAFVTTNDLIFSPQNQRQYWQQYANQTIEIDSYHFPFSAINQWNQLI